MFIVFYSAIPGFPKHFYGIFQGWNFPLFLWDDEDLRHWLGRILPSILSQKRLKRKNPKENIKVFGTTNEQNKTNYKSRQENNTSNNKQIIRKYAHCTHNTQFQMLYSILNARIRMQTNSNGDLYILTKASNQSINKWLQQSTVDLLFLQKRQDFGKEKQATVLCLNTKLNTSHLFFKTVQ